MQHIIAVREIRIQSSTALQQIACNSSADEPADVTGELSDVDEVPPPAVFPAFPLPRTVKWISSDHGQETVGAFREAWAKGHPVVVSGVHQRLARPDIWRPEWFLEHFGSEKVMLVDCLSKPQQEMPDKTHADFWNGFTDFDRRMLNVQGDQCLLKIKDWPTYSSFREILPEHFSDLMAALPINVYSNLDGPFNLSRYLPKHFNPPDLGPKMYIAYGSAGQPKYATTNLHVDISDAVNVAVFTQTPTGRGAEQALKSAEKELERLNLDQTTRERLKAGEVPGALWQIYPAAEAPIIAEFLRLVQAEKGLLSPENPIHTQQEFLDFELRQRLCAERGIRGVDIVQFVGDAVYIPAGAPHQVWNIHSCIKVAEDFVSPEHVEKCLRLTKEFRALPLSFHNKPDKLQIKSILYQTVKTLLSDVTAIPSPSRSHQTANAEGEGEAAPLLDVSHEEFSLLSMLLA